MLGSGITVTTGLVLLLFFMNWLHKRSVRRKIINQIPGPPENPLLGILLQFLIPPDAMWNYVRKLSVEYYPIYKYWQVIIPIVTILNPEDLEVILSSSTKHLTKSQMYHPLQPWLGSGLLTSTGKKWHNRRKILTTAFHFSILQQFLGVFIEQSELLVKTLQKECGNPHTNIVPIITQFTLHTICETAMGTKVDINDTIWKDYGKGIYRMGEILFYRITHPWYMIDLPYYLSTVYREQRKLLKMLHTASKNIIKNRKLTFQELNYETSEKHEICLPKKRLAMLDLLISAQNDGQPIDDNGIREEVDTFMFEGHDTTTACISFTLLLLACHKDIQERVVQELEEVFGNSDRTPTFQDLQNLSYMDRVIKESLRMYPSVPIIARVSDEEIHTPSGYTIPSGTDLQINIYDMHWNPKYFPEPEKFDPDRFLPENSKGRHPFVYIPFSAGPRNCIGQKFAILEIKSMVAAILRKFVLEPIDRPSDITMIIHIVLKTKNGIRIKFQERSAKK